MSKIFLNYIAKKFLKTFLIILLGFYCFGVILNLFEEIEFFKNTNAEFYLPITLTFLLIPGMVVKMLPFIIFISSMWFMLSMRNNKDLLTLKVFGYSNLKIFFILAFISFLLGWAILTLINPLTSTMSKYYERTKSNYSKDIDHLVTFNKNGLWIKENLNIGKRIISAEEMKDKNLVNISILHLTEKNDFIEKIIAEKADISNNQWILYNVKSFNDSGKTKILKNYKIILIYDYEIITGLFKNFNTMSFLDIIFKYDALLKQGYDKNFLDKTLNIHLTLPFLLMMMTGIASILTLNSLNKTSNIKYILLSFLILIFVFYFKDLSLALGQAGKISLFLSVWSPVIALSFFTFIGVLQINEK